MSKCKCKWRHDGVVFNDACTKIIRRWFCDIDSYDTEVGCCRNCRGYRKKNPSEEHREVPKNEGSSESEAKE